MQTAERTVQRGGGGKPTRPPLALVLTLGFAVAWSYGGLSAVNQVGRLQTYTRALGYLVSFRITQNSKQSAHGTNDQLMVIFSTRTVEGTVPPRPFFGDDILQEFSVSGRDFQKDEVRFTRRVRDKSFVDAPYIRVVNYGENSWAGDRIWLTVDGEQILTGVPMAPRIGGQTSEPFTHFNPENWRRRNYWEGQLQRLRPAPRAR